MTQWYDYLIEFFNFEISVGYATCTIVNFGLFGKPGKLLYGGHCILRLSAIYNYASGYSFSMVPNSTS